MILNSKYQGSLCKTPNSARGEEGRTGILRHCAGLELFTASVGGAESLGSHHSPKPCLEEAGDAGLWNAGTPGTPGLLFSIPGHRNPPGSATARGSVEGLWRVEMVTEQGRVHEAAARLEPRLRTSAYAHSSCRASCQVPGHRPLCCYLW